MYRYLLLVAVLATAVVLTGCSDDSKEEESKAAKKGNGGTLKLPVELPDVDAVAKAAATAAREAAAAAAKEAETLLQKIIADITAGDLDQAEKDLKTLEARKGSLSPELLKKVATARQSLDAAKKLQNPEVPEVPEVPGI